MSKKAFTPRAAENPGPSYTPRPHGPSTFQVAEDIIPIAELKAKLSEVVRGLDTRPRPIVVTLNGKPAAVVMSPREYDRLSYEARFLKSVARGLADSAAGRVISSDELRDRVAARYGVAAKRSKK
ncbi:MAG: type II toxin-antitoxin system Phd/YefM family antitoxin [Myxococcales bacterium]|nr:type II toxin-antitoxin system Phd/YefM family antitoxin [Myxococcales bacterium]